ncbi:MAG: hypothetical protein ACKOX3_01225 [Bacteroidota bacterium]
MPRKNLIVLLVLWLLNTAFCYAQTDSILGVADFSLDGLGNIYVAKKNAEFIKLNSSGKTVRINSRKDFGIPKAINAGNALRILIFYQEQGWLIVADNQLAFQADIDLKQFGFTDPTLIANAYDGGIWIFDRSNGTLNKLSLNATGPALAGSIDLRQILYTTLNPDQLVTDGNYLVLCNGNTLYLLDRYATFIRTMELDEKPFQVSIEGNTIKAYTMHSLFTSDIRYLSAPTKSDFLGTDLLVKSTDSNGQKIRLQKDGLLRISLSEK